MFVLTEAERIAILAGSVGLLCIVVLLTVCFVCPYCWFYQLITRRRSKEDAEMSLFRHHSPGLFFNNDPPPPYEVSHKNSFFDLHSPLSFGRRLTPMNSISTISSDTDSVTGIPLPSMSEPDFSISEMRETRTRGNVSVTLLFKRITGGDKKVFPQLRVDMKEASDLPPRPYGGSCDPYFIIALYDKNALKKKKKNKPGPSPIYHFYSTVVKKSQQPVYNESFFFPLEPNQLKKTVLKIEAWDQDKWANDTLLGETFFNLKDVNSFLLKEPSKELDLCLKMEDSKQTNGQILLGLCYLPTAERMTVAVLKATNLKVSNERNDQSEFCVQVMAIYGGKIFERRKTSSQPPCPFPVFNEMLMFDVPFTKLDQIVLMLTIRYNNNKENDEPADKENNQKTKDACIGKVVIGSFGRKSTSHHWHAMRSSPRRQIMQWHDLR